MERYYIQRNFDHVPTLNCTADLGRDQGPQYNKLTLQIGAVWGITKNFFESKGISDYSVVSRTIQEWKQSDKLAALVERNQGILEGSDVSHIITRILVDESSLSIYEITQELDKALNRVNMAVVQLNGMDTSMVDKLYENLDT